MPRKREPIPVAVPVAMLADKLNDMTLHDETGDPRDEGYMAAVRELRDWVTELPADTSGPGASRRGSQESPDDTH